MTHVEQKLIRVEEGHPEQCAVISSQTSKRCPFQRVQGSVNCARHGGTVAQTGTERREASDYRLQVWQQRLGEFAESDKVKSLRGEIGILRIMVEEILNRCPDRESLILFSPKISELCARIEKLVSSCHRIEHSMGSLMDKAAAIAFAGRVVDIISMHINDAEVIDKISNGIIDALGSITGKKD